MPETPPLRTFDNTVDGSTQAAGQSVDAGKGRIFPCEGCGADLTFHIGQQHLKCPFCGHEKAIEFAADATVEEQDFRAMLKRLETLKKKGGSVAEGQHEIHCEACGGIVVFVGSLTSSECPYCASPMQRDNVHDATLRIPVDGALPFLIEKKTADRNLAEWVRSRWFAPNDFQKRGIDGRFNGIYLPYWTFDSMTFTRYSGQRGKHYHVTVGSGKNRRTVRRTRWYPASGHFQRFFDDVLVLATHGLRRDMMQKLEPWPLQKCVPFQQELLAGFLARTYEIEPDRGFVEAKARIDESLERDVRRRIGGDVQRIHSIVSRYGALTFKHLLLPVWLLSYRYQDKVYQVMINASTGEVQGERPYSWIKITAAVLVGVAVAATLFFLFQS